MRLRVGAAPGPHGWVLLGATLSLILDICESAGGEEEEGAWNALFPDVLPPQPGEPFVPLNCHQCYRSVHGDDCVHMRNVFMLDKEECGTERPFCVTQWLKTNGDLTTFSRGCASSCSDGCEEAGERYQLQHCAKCCRQDYCNGHLGASSGSATKRNWTVLACAVAWVIRAWRN